MAGDWRDITDDREKYQAYLCSREWSVLRKQVRERSCGVCERCGVNAMDAVHHLTYARKYNELLTDLQAICNPCHEFTHGKRDEDPLRNTEKRAAQRRLLAAILWRRELVRDIPWKVFGPVLFQEYEDDATTGAMLEVAVNDEWACVTDFVCLWCQRQGFDHTDDRFFEVHDHVEQSVWQHFGQLVLREGCESALAVRCIIKAMRAFDVIPSRRLDEQEPTDAA